MKYWVANSIRSLQKRFQQALSNTINDRLLRLEGKAFDLHYSAEFRTPQQILIGSDCLVKARTILNGRSTERQFGINLGDDTYVKENCYFDSYGGFIEISGKCAFGQNVIIHGGGGVTIGSHSIFGANVYIISSNHVFQSPELPIMLQGDRRLGIAIGSNVWIGGNVTILDGAKIGNNCVIAAGSIIRGEVPSNCMVFQPREQKLKEMYDVDHH